MRHIRKILAKNCDGFRIEIDGGKTAKTRSDQSEAKPSATTKEICKRVCAWGGYYASHEILISFSRALNSGSPVTSSALFSFASAAAKASARLMR